MTSRPLISCRVLAVLILTPAFAAWSMDIDWVRMTGQEPVESAPLVANLSATSAPDIIAVNRIGQVLHWDAAGKALGPGQDGAAAQLPEGHWTTTPALVQDDHSATRLIACSVEGLVVGLDQALHIRWRYQLPGKTNWAHAIPLLYKTADGEPRCALADESGAVTALSLDGQRQWSTRLNAGPCKAPLQILKTANNPGRILAASGSTLFCLDETGKILWSRRLGGLILSQPLIVTSNTHPLIVCGAGQGSLYATSPDGAPVWETPIGDTIESTLIPVPRKNTSPLIVFTGYWGNLYAVDTDGHRVWTSLYRSRSRCKPLLADVNGDGHDEILVSAYDQHLYAFNLDGLMVDDLRLQGFINSSPVAIPDVTSGAKDFLFTTAALLAYRIKPGPPHSPYGPTGDAKDVTLTPPSKAWVEAPALTVENPHGALLRVNLVMTSATGARRILGRLTARTRFAVTLPPCLNQGSWSLDATAADSQGQPLAHAAWNIAPGWKPQPKSTPDGVLRAWPTPPYASFNAKHLAPYDNETDPKAPNTVSVNTLYQGERGEGAFVIASTYESPLRVRVTVDTPQQADKTPFAGTITLRQAVSVATVDGERVADALPALGASGLVTLPANHSAKIWLSIDARDSKPGDYTAPITVESLDPGIAPLKLTLHIAIPDLAMPKQFPLRLCTWDYVPNHWFPNATPALDDMSRHGVNIFPRTDCIPKATADANGNLTFDWKSLDHELDLLKGRGQILFQLGIPNIKFTGHPTLEQKHAADLAYLRQWRDHLKQHGLDYGDYAFYPTDEPGLAFGKRITSLTKPADLFHEADPRFRVYTDPVPTLSWKDFQRIKPLIDVWCPNMRLVSGLLAGDPRIKQILDSGKPVWSYECVGQVKSLSPLRYNRANAWRAAFFGLQGIGMWTHCTTPYNPWYLNTKSLDEYALVYPGKKPVPSARWEALRDGLQDIAALKLLQNAIHENQQKGTKPGLVAQAQQEIRLAETDIMELSDKAFIESRDYLAQGDRRIWHTWTDLTLYPHHRAKIAKLTEQLR